MTTETTIIDATLPENQWARIRCASRYRPLLEQYSTHELVYGSKPELYIVNSGINFEHTEFVGVETENFYASAQFNNDFTDIVGFGTAVASLAVGKNLGIARHCKLINVKIANTENELGLALDAIIARVSTDATVSRIVNISWTYEKSEAVDSKIQQLIDLGVTVVCASGDQGTDVSQFSPQSLDSVITVGPADKYDIPSGFNNIAPSNAGIISNYGSALDIFAPGEEVVAASVDGYQTVSGSAYASALVSGIACEIAAINSDVVTCSIVKQHILSSATTNVLLFDVDSQGVQRFSDEQNLLAYIFSSDPNANYKTKDMSMYLGVHDNAEKPITFNINSAINTDELVSFYQTQPVYSLEWQDSQLEAVYGEYVTVDSSTGCVTAVSPNVVLPEDTKLKMVSFVGVAKVGDVKISSPTFFYFHANPIYKDTQQTDITAALTETNSVSHFNYWGFYLK